VSDEVVISVEHLSKRYRLGETGAGTLKEAFAQWLEKTRRNMPDSRHAEAEEIWALRDVSFEVRRGEVLGVIGRNGAGKSTLLKILTRITEPTSGRAVLRGRAASLLEVGTGFHPDLTGRENIYLNGAILGMKKAEIARKFDEIVAFAELERFIDTPVKRYSSGMYVRLAFAVAAHLEADILLVDEVLAVGDAAFQRKCLNKMAEVTQKGRTVLFVSHNMNVIRQLCAQVLLLTSGRVTSRGVADDVVAHYLRDIESVPAICNTVEHSPRPYDNLGHNARILKVRACPRDGFTFAWTEPLRFEFEVRVQNPTIGCIFGITVQTIGGIRLFTCLSEKRDFVAVAPSKIIKVRAEAIAHAPTLAPGSYIVGVGVASGANVLLDVVYEALRFDIGHVAPGGAVYPGQPSYGPVCANVSWSIAEQVDGAI